MLAKPQRFFRTREITLIFRKGKKIAGRGFLCRYFLTDRSKKAIVVVSKKFSKSAVKRNQFRRMFYRIIAKQWDNLPSGIWYFSLAPDFSQSEEELANNLNQLISNVKTTKQKN